MSIKLHYAQPSQPSRAVAWFIRTHQLPVEFVDVNLFAQEHLTPAFAAKNLLQAVPVLELEDGTFLNESGAILLYLNKKFNVKGELPETPEGEARVVAAMLSNADVARQVSVGLIRPCLMRVANPAATWDDVKGLIDSKAAELQWAFGVLDGLLSKSAYIAGDQWTLADYNVAAEVSQWPRASAYAPDSLKLSNYPHIKAYLERVSQREGWAGFVAPFDFLAGLLQMPSA